MVDIEYIISKLPAPTEKKEMLVKRQNVYDIVKYVMDMHNEAANDYDSISEYFWKGNDIDTAKYIFDFCKKNIAYNIESSAEQTVKTPGVILRDALNGNENQDCKHYALFICGILDSLKRKGYPVNCKYRFASDIKNENYPKHVFSVMDTKEGEIWIDPVLRNFNQEHKFYYKKDKYPKMSLYKISGVDNEPNYMSGFQVDSSMSGFFDNIVKSVNTNLTNAGKSVNTNLTNAGKYAQEGIDFLKTAALAPARKAFLELLKLNFLDMAVKIHNHIKNNKKEEDRLYSIWHKLGGKTNYIKDGVKAGLNHYNNNHKGHIVSGFGYMGSGYVGTPLAAILAAAAPIIAALAPLLRSAGVDMAKVQAINQMAANGVPTVQAIEDLASGSGTGNNTLQPPPAGSPQTMTDYDGQEKKLPMGVPSNQDTDQTTDIATTNNKEIANPRNGIEEGVNVTTDWGKGVAHFIQNNRGTVITIGGLALAGLTVKYIFSPHKKRR